MSDRNKRGCFLVIIYLLIYLFPIAAVFISPILLGISEDIREINDYARITDVEYKAVVLDEPTMGGQVHITERLTFDIHAAEKDNLYWELWRALPESYVDGLKVDYKVLSVKEIKDNGKEKEYIESPKLYWYDDDYVSPMYGPGKWYHSKGPYNESLARYECVLFYVDGLYREQVTFEVQYIMNNASLKYSDVSELYLSMYSEETIEHLKSYKAEILIPEKDMPKEGNYLAHTYGTDSHSFEYEESKTKNPGYHTFSFDLDEDDLKFSNYNQYIEFTLLSFNEDKHIFTEYAPNNIYSYDVYLEEAIAAMEEYDNLPKEAEKNKIILFYIAIIISILVLIFVAKRDKRLRKKNTFHEPSTKIDYFREIPDDLDPHFAAELVFIKDLKHKDDDGNSYSAILLSLVRKGYIELIKADQTKDWTPSNTVINLLYNSKTNTQVTTGNNPNNQTLKDLINKNVLQVNQPSTATDTVVLKELYNKNGKHLENLTPNEAAYYNLIVRHAVNDSITMMNFQRKISSDYDNTDRFVTSIEKSTVNLGMAKSYFQKANYDSIKKGTLNLSQAYMILGILIIIIGNLSICFTRLKLAYGAFFILGIILILCSGYVKKQAPKYVLLTQLGEDEYAKWRGLYNFLNSETLMNERTHIELPLWEQYLIYATAFGISEKVTKVLEIVCPEMPDSPIINNNYYRSSSFRTSSRSFRTVTRSASSTSRSIRSSSGSYYGGGGRGGGGGGGGH